MSVFLRKHFWVVNLFSIALCAFFAARAVGHLVESKLPQPPARRTLPVAAAVSDDPPVTGPRDVAGILGRNVFCSTCEKVTETPTKSEAGDQPASNEPVKSSLNLKLLATLVSDEDKAWSYAAILDPADGKTRMFAIGQKVGEAVLTDVVDRRAYLQNAGRNEYLDLDDGAGQAPTASTGAPPVVAFKPAGLSGQEEEVAKSIRKVGEGKYEVERAGLNKVLANTTLLARSARIVPSVKDGQPNGFKLYAIRPGSLYSLLGMNNGDTINAINGHPMTTPDKALEIYTKLRNASHISITFARQGKTYNHEYTIR
jgi:general secretion pathway protein C